MYPKDLKYSKKHEWVRVEGTKARLGITHYAQEQLGAVVTVGLPKVGDSVERDSVLADIDSMKTADQIFTPVSGKVVEVNAELENRPELVNEDPYGEGWVAVIELSDPNELDDLMNADEYEAFIKEEQERK